MRAQVIDISHNNKLINFSKLSDLGIVAVFAKATEGLTFTDAKFDHYRNEADKIGILFQPYHFGNGENAIAQVRHFIDKTPGCRPRCLDWESNKNQMTLDGAEDFVQSLHDKQLSYPILYLDKSHYKTIPPTSILHNCRQWIAAYGRKAPPITNLTYLWQFDAYSEIYPGSGAVDMSTIVVNGKVGNVSQLKDWWPK